MSAGWVWHPFSVAELFDIQRALADPTHLDEGETPCFTTDWSDAEVNDVCWRGDHELLISASREKEVQEAETAGVRSPQLSSPAISVYDVNRRELVSSVRPRATVGKMMPIGKSHVIGFYDYPKLISLETGEVKMEWDQIKTGSEIASFLFDSETRPLALDPERRRFAGLGPGGIHVITLD